MRTCVSSCVPQAYESPQRPGGATLVLKLQKVCKPSDVGVGNCTWALYRSKER